MIRSLAALAVAALLLPAILLCATPGAATAETLELAGKVVSLADNHFVLKDAEGKFRTIWLLAASEYHPPDYRPALDDDVTVRALVGSRITRRLYLVKVVFVKENFQPAFPAEP